MTTAKHMDLQLRGLYIRSRRSIGVACQCPVYRPTEKADCNIVIYDWLLECACTRHRATTLFSALPWRLPQLLRHVPFDLLLTLTRSASSGLQRRRQSSVTTRTFFYRLNGIVSTARHIIPTGASH